MAIFMVCVPFKLCKLNIELLANLVRRDNRQKWWPFPTPKRNKTMEVIRLCNFLRVQVVPHRHLLWLLARDLPYGALSLRMLYGADNLCAKS